MDCVRSAVQPISLAAVCPLIYRPVTSWDAQVDPVGGWHSSLSSYSLGVSALLETRSNHLSESSGHGIHRIVREQPFLTRDGVDRAIREHWMSRSGFFLAAIAAIAAVVAAVAAMIPLFPKVP